MKHTDPRVDASIAKAAEFAQPILKYIRKAVHAGCPDVKETLKWGMPFFVHHGVLCGMAAFKQHCTFGFWKHALIVKRFPELAENADQAMGQFGKVFSLKDLPKQKQFVLYVKFAAALNEDGVTVPKAKKSKKPAPKTPYDLLAALKMNKKALATWEKFSPSCRREYIEWIDDAKQAETRQRRLATTLEWVAAGKDRNWKYNKK